jgi:AcrR family transcriptional regulator
VTGRRERKKADTRRLLAETAWRLFAERGFDRVPVSEVARAADVAPATVFNYFPTKEDLFFGRLDAYAERLRAAVADRPPGEPVVEAYRRHLLETDGGLLAEVAAGDAAALDRLRTVNRVIADSPALLARERQALAEAADALAALLGGDLRAQVAATALVGVQRALIDLTRRRVLADDAPDRLAADVHRLGTDAFTLLATGLADYPA